jgi:hypothetical protein
MERQRLRISLGTIIGSYCFIAWLGPTVKDMFTLTAKSSHAAHIFGMFLVLIFTNFLGWLSISLFENKKAARTWLIYYLWFHLFLVILALASRYFEWIPVSFKHEKIFYYFPGPEYAILETVTLLILMQTKRAKLCFRH